MRIHDLRPAPGSAKEPKRVGRGRASGHGKTSGRGQKGQLSRSGGGKGPGFEGGQNPLQRRLPKLPGFKNRFKKIFSLVNVSQLERFDDGGTVDPAALLACGLIKKTEIPVKILGDGEIKKKLTVRAAGFTGAARQKIEAAGGQVEVLVEAGGRRQEAEGSLKSKEKAAKSPEARGKKLRPKGEVD